MTMLTEADFDTAASHDSYSHARARSWRASGVAYDDGDYIVTIYHRDPASPSGVTQAATLHDFKRAVEILDRRGRVFPLSAKERY